MKSLLFAAALAAGLLLLNRPLAAAAVHPISGEFDKVAQKIMAKLQQGEPSAEALAPEIKEIDALLAKYPGDQAEEIAMVLYMKAMLFVEVLSDPELGARNLARLKQDFPGSKYAKDVDAVLASLESQAAAMKIQSALKVGSEFPLFAVKDSTGQPLALADYRGKVVLVDFWAMWCGPCIAELPTVVQAYKDYHARGFEIVGISLDRDGDGPKLATFTKDKEMPWRQFFDGKYWENELARTYGVNSIPATYLLDAEGRILAKNLRGPALAAALEKALPKK
jgi:peroxiredoxin